VSVDPLASACQELRRLIGLPEDVEPATLARLFSDPKHEADLYQPRTSRELCDVFKARSHAPPPTAEAIASAVAAFWRWARVGFGVVDPETLTRRLDACGGCEHCIDAPPGGLHALARRAVNESKICACCGCFVRKKARMETEACPTGRW
jgi:hypothetical protein